MCGFLVSALPISSESTQVSNANLASVDDATESFTTSMLSNLPERCVFCFTLAGWLREFQKNRASKLDTNVKGSATDFHGKHVNRLFAVSQQLR